MSNLTHLPTVHPLEAMHARLDARNASRTNNVTVLPTSVHTVDTAFPIGSVILMGIGIILGVVFPIVWNFTH